MPDVQLPDGSVAHFPDSMNDAEIEAALQKQFPQTISQPARPSELPASGIRRRWNGVCIVFDGEVERFVVYDWDGTARGFRCTLDEAIDLADNLQRPVPRKVRARPEPVETPPLTPAQAYTQVDAHISQTASRARLDRSLAARTTKGRNRGTT